ncbi:MAG: sporulation protein YunB [Eubacteriales Family XIII. Incertae Sedis bacterium]|nr:MAG: sporulation protein YunB [Clostridiales Family XIII bacterium]
MIGGIFMSRRSVRRKNYDHRAFKLAVLVILMGLITYMAYFWVFRISPNLEAVSAIKTKSIVNRIVNETINEKFGNETSAGNLLITETDEEGSIEMVQSNTAAINNLISELLVELQDRYKNGEAGTDIEVPIGSLIGSKILSQSGPTVELTIIPVAVSKIDFITEFESQGINQTKYKVYVVLSTEARVMAPFSMHHIEVESTILVAEAIILGKVPESFVQVPKESILDAV